MRHRFTAGPMLMSALLVCASCQSRPRQTDLPPLDWQTLERDVGEITAGVEISHTFTLANDLTGTVHVEKDSDIKANCGCATLVPAARELSPQATTSVTVKAGTLDKVGPFKLGGRITWTDSEGSRHVSAFALTGIGLPPLALQPNALVFEREEIAKGLGQELRVTLSPDVDEASLTVEAGTDALTIQKSHVEKRCRTYSVKCVRQPQGEEEEVHDIYLSAKLTPAFGGTAVSARLLVYVQEVVPLDVRPKALDLRLGPDGRATGKLFLSGDAMRNGGSVESVSCADYQLEWKVTRGGTGTQTAVLEITLLVLPDKPRPPKSTLQVKVKGLPALHVPITVRD